MEKKTAAFVFGRFNPVTNGHLLLWEKLCDAPADSRFIFTSHSQDKKKNPLSYETKSALIKYILKSRGLDAEFVKSEARTIMEVAYHLYSEGFTDLIIVAGSDRVDDLVGLLRRYNGKSLNKAGDTYDFNSIESIKAGDRDPDADDVSGVSASKVRQFAIDGDFKSFSENIPVDDKMIAKSIYDEIRDVMLR